MATPFPFLIFILVCAFIVGLLFVLFKMSAYFGRSDADKFRAVRCSVCQTRRKAEKTGTVRNLVEFELKCPVCGHISWDVPPKTNLSTRPKDRD